MKTQTIVTEITHDDLVKLIATAWEGSNWLGFDIPAKSGIHLQKIKNECREDSMARVLLAGDSIFVKDYYAKDESDHYGNIKHLWRIDCMAYDVTLEDIKKGIGRAMDSGGYIRDYINHWADDESMSFDLTEAEAVMQWIVFGEEIYG